MKIEFGKIETGRGYSSTEPHVIWYMIEDIAEIEFKVTFYDPLRMICGEILMEFSGTRDEILDQYDYGNYVDLPPSNKMIEILEVVIESDLLD